MPHCTAQEGCTNEAVATFTWPWGDNGVVCQQHQVLLHQQAHNLKRQVFVTPMQPGAPTPVTREERIAAHATALALTEENAELRQVNQDLYSKLQTVQQSLSTELAKVAALDASLKERTEQLAASRAEVGAARQAAADAGEEARVLRGLQKVDPAKKK